MREVFGKAGRAALLAVVPVLVAMGYGLLGAKDLNSLKLQATTGIIAATVAVLTAIQAFVPQLSFEGLLDKTYAKYLDAFVRGGLGSLITLLIGYFGAPEVHFTLAAWTAIVVGALQVGARAVLALFTPGETPAPNLGVTSKLA